jgi:hypothetical protein
MPSRPADIGAAVDPVVGEKPALTNPLLEQLKVLLGQWEHMAYVLENGFYSAGAFCSDVCWRNDIDDTLQALQKQLSAVPHDWTRRLNAADEQFRAATAPFEPCIVDVWQEKLVQQGKAPWQNWTIGQTNPQDHWYFYRQPT